MTYNVLVFVIDCIWAVLLLLWYVRNRDMRHDLMTLRSRLDSSRS